MSQRFGPSHLHQRDPRSALFAGYTGDQARRPPSAQSGNSGYGYGYPGTPNSSLSPDSNGKDKAGYRPATPNKKGQYSDAVLNELESQNDAQVAGILGKVRVLKDMTSAIGDEIRDSSALAEKMNDTFDQTRVRLRGTMNRMLLMAERTGVSWKIWLAFFAAVILLFMYVWLF
jgi:blocked-early-in-transport protein 1